MFGEYPEIQIKKSNEEITIVFGKHDPIATDVLKEIADMLKAKGRRKEGDRAEKAANDPPEIDPGG